MYIPGNSVGKSQFQEKKLALQHRSMYIVATTFLEKLNVIKER